MTNEYILGDGRSVDTIEPEELYATRKECPALVVWSNCFIKLLIQRKMQIDDFITIYKEYVSGDKTRLLDLKVLPDRLEKNKRLGIKYLESLMYVTFKRDIRYIAKEIIK